MKPQKRSIRDFFTPVSQGSHATSTPTPPFRAASPSSRSAHSAPLTINTPAVSGAQDTVTPPPVPASSGATTTDAQPPTTSQTSANSGASKRTVSNGEQVVLNSDSDSDSLPDLDWGVPTASLKTIAPITRSKRTTETDDDGLRKPERKRASKKRPFDQVLDTVQKNREIEQRIIEHKAHLQAPEDAPSAQFTFDEDALGKAIEGDDDPDKAHRLFLAMQRTNATQEDKVYHFFRDRSDSIAVRSRFPFHTLPKHRWTSCFLNAATRDQAFHTGFAYQAFRLQELPEELASWMIDQICFEESEALDSRYLELLEAHHDHLSTLLDRNRLDAIFRTIGGDVKGLASGSQFLPAFDTHQERVNPLPRPLKSIVRLLERAAPWLRTKTRGHAFLLLCHVCLDDRVLTDMDLLRHVQNAVETIICNFADNQKLTQGVGSSTFHDSSNLIIAQLSDVLPQLALRLADPILQRNLVRALPAESPLTSYLQRHIALCFLLHPTMVNFPLADPQLPDLLHRHLDTLSNLRINKNTNYGFLAARMTLLDVAIGPGLPSVPYLPLTSPAPSQAGSSPIMAPAPEMSETREFNRVVDALAQHVKMLGNSIVEAGAVVDLTILEAKDSVERLSARLEHAVRIGGKKHHDVFGNESEAKQLRVTDIFRKAAKSRKAPPASGIFDDDDDDEAAASQLRMELAS
ncbi:hypothetical protein FB567DRAFT_437532 [Paraphoma chrysanthemicola]|uniref:Uncharacterized protein n=1 Tax=Paraphoma chrysanthemicola TaxID=798071 RepID=A0A8K0W0L6_9PLEO|nr:hypothetical protein FB567DRAFT_437532 [Paraphoma chrysanthemicola]